MKEYEMNKDVMLSGLNVITNMLSTITFIEYGRDHEDKQEPIYFMRTLLMNVFGNFIINSTVKDVPNALEMNIETVITEFREWFKMFQESAAKENKEKH